MPRDLLKIDILGANIFIKIKMGFHGHLEIDIIGKTGDFMKIHFMNSFGKD